jgi:hypothetical protein
MWVLDRGVAALHTGGAHQEQVISNGEELYCIAIIGRSAVLSLVYQ